MKWRWGRSRGVHLRSSQVILTRRNIRTPSTKYYNKLNVSFVLAENKKKPPVCSPLRVVLVSLGILCVVLVSVIITLCINCECACLVLRRSGMKTVTLCVWPQSGTSRGGKTSLWRCRTRSCRRRKRRWGDEQKTWAGRGTGSTGPWGSSSNTTPFQLTSTAPTEVSSFIWPWFGFSEVVVLTVFVPYSL